MDAAATPHASLLVRPVAYEEGPRAILAEVGHERVRDLSNELKCHD
jgi:hypothetical protein